MMPMHNWKKVSSNLFHDFHLGWIASLRTALNQQLLPQGYFARAEQRQPMIAPDVLTLHDPRLRGVANGSAPTAVLTPPLVQHFTTEKVNRPARRPERYVGIRESGSQTLVAVIEVVSRSNKRRPQIDRFLQKVVDLLDTGIHVMLLDVYPPRKHDPAGLHALIWPQLIGSPTSMVVKTPCLTSYMANLDDGEFTACVEPVAIGSPLTPMPLYRRPDFYVNIPLEAIYNDALAGLAQCDQDELARA